MNKQMHRNKTRKVKNGANKQIKYYVPAKTSPEPTDPQRPPGRRVAPQAPPAEHQVRRERLPRRQGREEQ